MSNIEKFDGVLNVVNKERMLDYGHPADDFEKVAKLKAALPNFDDPRIRHIAEVICIKLARLSNNQFHLDSWIDIAGYARCAVLIMDREQENQYARVREERTTGTKDFYAYSG